MTDLGLLIRHVLGFGSATSAELVCRVPTGNLQGIAEQTDLLLRKAGEKRPWFDIAHGRWHLGVGGYFGAVARLSIKKAEKLSMIVKKMELPGVRQKGNRKGAAVLAHEDLAAAKY
jgi:hypothetical protein